METIANSSQGSQNKIKEKVIVNKNDNNHHKTREKHHKKEENHRNEMKKTLPNYKKREKNHHKGVDLYLECFPTGCLRAVHNHFAPSSTFCSHIGLECRGF